MYPNAPQNQWTESQVAEVAAQQSAQLERPGYIKGARGASGSIPLYPPDSLAQVAPRLITAALEVGKIAEHIESSLGISVPTKDATNALNQQPTLMSQLKMVEAVLQRAALALENINRHVNG